MGGLCGVSAKQEMEQNQRQRRSEVTIDQHAIVENNKDSSTKHNKFQDFEEYNGKINFTQMEE